jgi:ABC-2 type transport system ATP-binding protein
MENIIEVKNVSMTIGNFSLKNISFAVPSNKIIALVGGNGSGKSVLIRTLLNIIESKEGEINFFGKSLNRKEKEIKNQIGIVFDDGFFFEQLTIKQMTEIVSNGYSEWKQSLFEKYLRKFNLQENTLIKDLSKGMKMKYALALSLSHNAKLLILDEPTSGLDMAIRKELLKLLRDEMQNSDKTILFSSHIVSDIDTLADQLIILEQGSLIFDGSVEEFKNLQATGRNRSLEDALVSVIGGESSI